LTQSIQKVQQEEKLSQELANEKHSFLNSCDPTQCDIGDIRHRDYYLTSLDSRIKSQHTQLDNAKKTSNIIRLRVVDATSRRKILENLKDKKIEEYHQLFSQTEQKMLDEVGINTYYRKQVYPG
jgi:flagellar FliJ protein